MARLLEEVRACRICEAHLPLGPRPILRLSTSARLLIVGQAPGRRVHETGIPWNDPSGERLRSWTGLEPERFYDTSRVAILPMGYCYPGRGRSGDLPPRRECAETWHGRLIDSLSNVRLTLLVGRYAQVYFLAEPRRRSLTATVSSWRDYGRRFFPLPHPSPRNQGWFRRNPWFARDLLPELRERVAEAVGREDRP